MLSLIGKKLSDDDLDRIAKAVSAAAEEGDRDAAWDLAKPLRNAQAKQRSAAESLLRLTEWHCFTDERGLESLKAVAGAYADDPAMLAKVGIATEGARNIDDLNLKAPDDPFFIELVDTLDDLLDGTDDREQTIDLLSGLGTAARMSARQQDEIAELAYRRLIELSPTQSSAHYNLGLFAKTRGHFREGVVANQRAIELADETVEAYEWNLGICATGAGDGGLALEVWKRMQQKIEMGRFDLPEGGYPTCKVRLAERPLAERDSEHDDPGLEETIWIERLSPCHGIIRSVLYQDLGVDFGDVVLIDGAPVTYHTYGEREVPVFPHLATLRRNGYRFFDFAGTQDEAGRLESASKDLPADTVVYSHTENFRIVCKSCWSDPDIDHEQHEEEQKHVVTGRIAVPPQLDLGDVSERLDSAIEARAPCQIFAPDLSAAAGRDERLTFERRRFEMLFGERG